METRLNNEVNFIVIYDIKKTAFFCLTDQISDLSRNDVIYEITCPGCDKKYIGKTERRLETRLTEHCKHFDPSAVAQHFHNTFHTTTSSMTISIFLISSLLTLKT